MVSRKTTRIAAIVLLVLAMGLVLRFVAGPATGGRESHAGDKATPETKLKPGTQRAAEPIESTSRADVAPKTKLAQRKESLGIRDLEKYGIVVGAEQIGKNSASGKVRVTVKTGGPHGDAGLEAERVKMSVGGMLVAEGNPVMVQGEARFSVPSETGALAIYFDEETQHVKVRGADAHEITDPTPFEGEVEDPDRNMSK
jgi:hypothetical protein